MNALALRPVDETGTALAAYPEPTLAAILSTVAAAYSLSEGEIRLGADELAAGARDEFVWLCEQLKACSVLACASYVGMPVSDAIGAIANVERQRKADPALHVRLEEACLALHCEAVALSRLDLTPRDASRPVDIARRVMVSRRHAGSASIEDIQTLGGAYLALYQDRDAVALCADLKQARAALETAEAEIIGLREMRDEAQDEIVRLKIALDVAQRQAARPIPRAPAEPELREWAEAALALDSASGPGERTARSRFDRACQMLSAAAEKHFNLTRKFK